MSEIHSDSVRIVLFDAGAPDTFLTLSETDDPDNFKLPGGKFEVDETPLEAAVRELDEELGLSPDEVGLQGAGELQNQHDATSKRFIFVGHVAAGFVNPSPEIAQTIWSSRQDIPEGKNQKHILSALDLAVLFIQS